MAAGCREDSGIEIAIDCVTQEKPAEEQDLGGEEDPHAKLVRFVLLLEVVKLLGDQAGRFAHLQWLIESREKIAWLSFHGRAIRVRKERLLRARPVIPRRRSSPMHRR